MSDSAALPRVGRFRRNDEPPSAALNIGSGPGPSAAQAEIAGNIYDENGIVGTPGCRAGADREAGASLCLCPILLNLLGEDRRLPGVRCGQGI
jgi:hypothetical protein